MSTKSELKENILASKLEVVLQWLVVNRTTALIAGGIAIAAALLASVFAIRNKETRELNYTRFAQAQAFVSQERYAEGELILNDLAAASTDNTLSANVAYYQGLAAIGKKDFDKAITMFQNSVEKFGKSPIRPLALSNLGYAYEQKKDFNSAAGTYGRFMTEYGDHFLAPRVQLYLGQDLALAGKMDEARKALGQLIDLYPTSAWAENARSFLDKNKTR